MGGQNLSAAAGERWQQVGWVAVDGSSNYFVFLLLRRVRKGNRLRTAITTVCLHRRSPPASTIVIPSSLPSGDVPNLSFNIFRFSIVLILTQQIFHRLNIGYFRVEDKPLFAYERRKGAAEYPFAEEINTHDLKRKVVVEAKKEKVYDL
ncbi:unnamed protein product [Lactuca virosa]|uniref:Uncharacterized protein n=1 Tax=Lactuca virosa TaxID=75947 RepID=A0AAU9PJH6_9ASTR|nr:unnamed protein product [Lactuca virosa]